MSIVALKRNSRRFKARISGQGSKGFSLSGGHRNQGWVGQGVRGRSLTGTPFRGAVPMGNGGCCGTYVKKINNRSSNCCTNDPNIVKRSTMNTLGHIDSTVIYPTAVFSDSCRDGKCPKIQNWVKDFSPLNHSEGQRIFKVARENGKCVNLKDDAGLDTCHKGCKSASYHIGGKKVVREMYSKNLNMLAVGSEEYQRTSLMSTVNLPTPDCKKPYPMELNHTGSCQKNFMTSDDAIKGGMLPKDWMNCDKCLNPGMSYITHLDSQYISTQTPLRDYNFMQRSKLDGQVQNKLSNTLDLTREEIEFIIEAEEEEEKECQVTFEDHFTGQDPLNPNHLLGYQLIPLDDDDVRITESLGGEILINGTPYTHVSLSSNGYMQFLTSATDQLTPENPFWWQGGMGAQFLPNTYTLLPYFFTDTTMYNSFGSYMMKNTENPNFIRYIIKTQYYGLIGQSDNLVMVTIYYNTDQLCKNQIHIHYYQAEGLNNSTREKYIGFSTGDGNSIAAPTETYSAALDTTTDQPINNGFIYHDAAGNTHNIKDTTMILNLNTNTYTIRSGL